MAIIVLLVTAQPNTALAQNPDELPVREGASSPSFSLTTPGQPVDVVRYGQSLYITGQGELPDSVVGDRKGVVFKYDAETERVVNWAIGLDTPSCLGVNDSVLFVSEGNRILRFRHDTGAVVRTDTIAVAGTITDLFLTADSLLLIADPDSNAIRVLDLRNDSLYAYDLPELRHPVSVRSYGGMLTFVERGTDKLPGRLVAVSPDNLAKSWHVFPGSEHKGGYTDLHFFEEAKLFLLITPPLEREDGPSIPGQLLYKNPFDKARPQVILESVPMQARIQPANNGRELFMTDPENQRVLIFMHTPPGNAGASR